jgi:hypothetical protein
MRARTKKGRGKATPYLSAARKTPRPFRVYSVVLLSVGHDPHQTKKVTKGRVIVSWDRIPYSDHQGTALERVPR